MAAAEEFDEIVFRPHSVIVAWRVLWRVGLALLVFWTSALGFAGGIAAGAVCLTVGAFVAGMILSGLRRAFLPAAIVDALGCRIPSKEREIPWAQIRDVDVWEETSRSPNNLFFFVISCRMILTYEENGRPVETDIGTLRSVPEKEIERLRRMVLARWRASPHFTALAAKPVSFGRSVRMPAYLSFFFLLVVGCGFNELRAPGPPEGGAILLLISAPFLAIGVAYHWWRCFRVPSGIRIKPDGIWFDICGGLFIPWADIVVDKATGEVMSRHHRRNSLGSEILRVTVRQGLDRYAQKPQGIMSRLSLYTKTLDIHEWELEGTLPDIAKAAQAMYEARQRRQGAGPAAVRPPSP
jgi:hypothetical protein